MLNDLEKELLKKYYPDLVVGDDEVSGFIEFKASYDIKTNLFTIYNHIDQTPTGLVLDGKYQIVIKKNKNDKRVSILEIVDFAGEYALDRHFYSNKSACLCGPVEGLQFIESKKSFLHFVEELIIPFLYGQSYYDIYKKWPWSEYSHGSAGVLQSYYRSGESYDHAKICLNQLKKIETDWPRVEKVLSGEERIIESSKCFCAKHGSIGRCHPDVWLGIRKLSKALEEYDDLLETS